MSSAEFNLNAIVTRMSELNFSIFKQHLRIRMRFCSSVIE